jgi:hypothetical protein
VTYWKTLCSWKRETKIVMGKVQNDKRKEFEGKELE